MRGSLRLRSLLVAAFAEEVATARRRGTEEEQGKFVRGQSAPAKSEAGGGDSDMVPNRHAVLVGSFANVCKWVAS